MVGRDFGSLFHNVSIKKQVLSQKKNKNKTKTITETKTKQKPHTHTHPHTHKSKQNKTINKQNKNTIVFACHSPYAQIIHIIFKNL